MGKCRLCLKDRKLIKAHIIPEFIYGGMKAADDQNLYERA